MSKNGLSLPHTLPESEDRHFLSHVSCAYGVFIQFVSYPQLRLNLVMVVLPYLID